MGHAENFFSSQLSYIRSTLSRLNIDDGTRSLSQIVSLICQVIMSADVLYSEASNISANRATELWYATQPRWHLIESDGLIKKWVKE